MNFGNLKKLARAYIPGAKTSALDDITLPIILNEGALDVAARLQCLKNFGYINAVEDQESYRLSTAFDKFLSITDSGIWILNGSTYQELEPETIRSLDNKFKTWRGESASLAERYALFGDLMIPHPFVDTNITRGFLVYYCERPEEMSEDDHFPFHLPDDQEAERSDLAILSDLVLMYTEWKVLKVLNKREDAYAKLNEYIEELERKRPLINLRPDISSHDQTRFQGPSVGG